ncbi:hypothetical protein PUN28_003832 [Cardiocondyla obscurior]|uniref:Uncharacterized protein n=1 Tax=Cardiocondyla obscurior TaxID=286306 RepID=A0AAW2GP47_9HYME
MQRIIFLTEEVNFALQFTRLKGISELKKIKDNRNFITLIIDRNKSGTKRTCTSYQALADRQRQKGVRVPFRRTSLSRGRGRYWRCREEGRLGVLVW